MLFSLRNFITLSSASGARELILSNIWACVMLEARGGVLLRGGGLELRGGGLTATVSTLTFCGKTFGQYQSYIKYDGRSSNK